MATVLGGVSFGVYTVAKRYIVPLIAPPTPPQLEQDKASIDAQFEKAFALLDQLATDTDELKKSEQDRSERLDSALEDVQAIVAQIKDSSKRRDDEGRRLADEVRVVKEMIPRAMESQKDAQDQRLKDLAAEMKSLKTLISNRMAAPAPAPSTASYSSRPNPTAASFTPPSATAGSTSTPSSQTPAADSTSANTSQSAEPVSQPSSDSKPTPSSAPDRSSTSSPYGRMMNGRAASIPAWQMAANKKNQEAKEKSGTVEPANAGAGEGATA